MVSLMSTPSSDRTHCDSIFSIGLSQTILTKFKGTFDVADIRLLALDETALKKTERSPIFAEQSKPRLIPFSPILGKIPLYDPTVEFRFFGYLPKGTTENDFEAVLEVEGASGASRAPLALKDGIRLAVPGAVAPAQGVFAVSIERKSTGERVFTERHRYALRDVPRELKKGRRLNNLTSELVSARRACVKTETFPFDVYRDSWLFIASPRGSTVRLDGKTVFESRVYQTADFVTDQDCCNFLGLQAGCQFFRFAEKL